MKVPDLVKTEDIYLVYGTNLYAIYHGGYELWYRVDPMSGV